MSLRLGDTAPDFNAESSEGPVSPSHDEVYTVRTVFVIDPKKKIRLTPQPK